LDSLINNAEMQLKLLNEDKRYAYVAYQDLMDIPALRRSTCHVIKAPPETELRYEPDVSQGYRIYLKSKSTEISVMYVAEPNAESREGQASSEEDSDTSPIQSPVKFTQTGIASGYPLPREHLNFDLGPNSDPVNSSGYQTLDVKDVNLVDDVDDLECCQQFTTSDQLSNAVASLGDLTSNDSDHIEFSDLFSSCSPGQGNLLEGIELEAPNQDYPMLYTEHDNLEELLQSLNHLWQVPVTP